MLNLLTVHSKSLIIEKLINCKLNIDFKVYILSYGLQKRTKKLFNKIKFYLLITEIVFV